MRGGEKFNIRENRERKIEYKVEETQDKLDNKKDKKNPTTCHTYPASLTEVSVAGISSVIWKHFQYRLPTQH